MAKRRGWARCGVALAMAAALGLPLAACGAPEAQPSTSEDWEPIMDQSADVPETPQPSTDIPTAPPEGETVPGEVLVTVAADAEAPKAGEEIAGTTVESVEVVGSDANGGTIYQLTLADASKTDAAIAELNEEPGYAAQSNHVYHLM